MLKVKSLTCGYGAAPVVRDVSFTLAEGQRLVILGPNGCGKTTLLRALMGILPFTGSVELDGRDLAALSPRERSRELAMLTQMNAADCLRRLGLWEERDRPITRLSGGQLQRVMLARAFAQSPKVILLDEPANHLDLKYRLELTEELKSWTSRPGRAAVGVFHDLDLALDFADTALLMDGGRAVFLGPVEKLDPAELSRVFGLDVPAHIRASRKRWEKLGG